MQTNPIWIRTSINNQHIMCNGKVYGKFSVGKLCGYSLNYAGWCAKLVWLRLVGRFTRIVAPCILVKTKLPTSIFDYSTFVYTFVLLLFSLPLIN